MAAEWIVDLNFVKWHDWLACKSHMQWYWSLRLRSFVTVINLNVFIIIFGSTYTGQAGFSREGHSGFSGGPCWDGCSVGHLLMSHPIPEGQTETTGPWRQGGSLEPLKCRLLEKCCCWSNFSSFCVTLCFSSGNYHLLLRKLLFGRCWAGAEVPWLEGKLNSHGDVIRAAGVIIFVYLVFYRLFH